jgi:hypothetical protein
VSTAPPFEPAEIAEARADAEAQLLPERCTIRRRPPGGVFATVAVDVPCFLEITGATGRDPSAGMTGGERRMGARLDVPSGTDVMPGDVALLAGWRFEAEGVDPDELLLRSAYGRVEVQ